LPCSTAGSRILTNEMPKTEFRIGQRVRVVSLPPLVDMPRETQAIFSKCFGQVIRIDGVGPYGHLELNVLDDGSQAPDCCHHTIWIEPEHVEMASDPRNVYGDEYPVAVTMFGVRCLSFEKPAGPVGMRGTTVRRGSRYLAFMDGTAAITFEELRGAWPLWSQNERLNFCHACSKLHPQTDFPDIL